MSNDIKINEIEARKLNLKPGDVLMLTIKSNEVNEHALEGLKEFFNQLFPNNKVAILGVREGGDAQFSVISQQEMADNEKKQEKTDVKP